MAFVKAGTQVMTVTIEDRDQNTASASFYVPSAVVTADVDEFATTTLPTKLGALSDGYIRRITVTQTYENDTYTQPVEACDIERKGSFVWKAEDRSVSKNEIPSFKNTLVVDGTNIVDVANAAVSDFIAMVVDTGLLDVYGLGNSRGTKIVATASTPVKIHRKNSRG
jgi:hypothetical protein